MNTLPLETQIRTIASLCEGGSIRSTERTVGVHRDTVMRLSLRIGEGCERLHDRMMRDLQVGIVELDEQWTFIGKKKMHLQDGDPAEYGDSWLWIALAANQKAVVSYLVGKRNRDDACAFVEDLSMRILNRPQISSDGFAPYIGAVDIAFGWDADYAMVEKKYDAPHGNAKDAAHRYSPARVREVEKTILRGNPDPSAISTSYVERFNLSTRTNMKRYTRLTISHSKRLRNHAAAVALWIAFYNFCRCHDSLGRRTTPAMALGITDHPWSIAELIEAANDPTEPPELTPPMVVREKIGTLQLRLIKGGKS
jgi:IS1 family transposase